MRNIYVGDEAQASPIHAMQSKGALVRFPVAFHPVIALYGELV